MSEPSSEASWSREEDDALKQLVALFGCTQHWETIAGHLEQRTGVMCEARWARLLESGSSGYTKGPWTEEEDRIIVGAVEKVRALLLRAIVAHSVAQRSQGMRKWSEIAKLVPGHRIGKQCRERWFNHLSPELKKSPWSEEEDQALVDAQAVLGNSWSRVALDLPGRR